MDPLPYVFLCSRCGQRLATSAYDAPAAARCGQAAEHAWLRQVDPRRVAAHEAAHAIAAAVLLGTASVQAVHLERPSQSYTSYDGRPDSPEALLIALSGPAASARTGDARDGVEQDMRAFRRGAFSCLVHARARRPDTLDDRAGAAALSRSIAIMRDAYEAAATELVERWEPTIDALAASILQERVLAGRRLTSAIERALAERPGGRFESPVLDPAFADRAWRLASG